MKKTIPPSHLFSKRQWYMIPTLFIGIVLILHFIARTIRYSVFFDMDNYWPISLVWPRPPVWQDFVTLTVVLFLGWMLIQAVRQAASIGKITAIGFALILATNLFNGIHDGLVTPITGKNDSDHQYWQDVERITTVPALMKHYVAMQPTLNIHSRVHPPGPMIIYYLLRQLNSNPIFIGITLLAICCLSAPLLFSLLRPLYGETVARILAALLLLLPANQIYYYSTIDALISFFFLAALWAWQRHHDVRFLFLTALIMALGMGTTFTVAIMVPILIFDDWRRNKTVKHSILLLIILGSIYLAFRFLLGYDYLDSLRVGSSFEGPGLFKQLGFLSYFFSRIENVLEIIVFFGPYLALLLFQSIKRWLAKKPFTEITTSAVILVGLLLLFFLRGGYFTGETARATNFIYPFLLIIIAPFLKEKHDKGVNLLPLLTVVFAQSVLMQFFAWYVW